MITAGEIIFIIIIIIWLCLGMYGAFKDCNGKANWSLIVFLFSTPLLAVVAYFCGIDFD